MSLRTSKTSQVSFQCLFRVRSDPTAGSVEFGVSEDRTTPPTVWASGSWGDYTALTGRVEATTPTIGSASADIDLSTYTAGRLVLWYRTTLGLEVDELPFEDEPITLIN